ncbi:MAG: hypothetical protein HQK83_16425 [Fibrobacteria bacterium]|nr:hypothetical protein [Fibrobacteria bacterium]
MGYLSKKYPLSTEKISPRSVVYIVDDPLLLFWYKFIHPNTSSIIYQGKENTFSALIRPKLEAYFGYCFERICKAGLPYIYNKENVISPFEIGSFWDKHMQIDVVGIRQDRWIDLCECKWGPNIALKKTAVELMKKCENYPNRKNFTIRPRIFVRQIRKNSVLPDHVSIHTLEDLYTMHNI